MSRKATVGVIGSLVLLSIPLAIWLDRPRGGPVRALNLPGTVLSDAEMQSVLGGHGEAWFSI